MRLILAVIQPTKLDAVRTALARIGVEKLSICDAQGYTRQHGLMEMFRGRRSRTQLLRKVILEIAVNDDFLERTVECIAEVARTGSEGTSGDGKILVLPIAEAIQIGPTMRGKEAV